MDRRTYVFTFYACMYTVQTLNSVLPMSSKLGRFKPSRDLLFWSCGSTELETLNFFHFVSIHLYFWHTMQKQRPEIRTYLHGRSDGGVS